MGVPNDSMATDRHGYSPSRRDRTTERAICGECGARLRMSYPRQGTAMFCPECDVLVYHSEHALDHS